MMFFFLLFDWFCTLNIYLYTNAIYRCCMVCFQVRVCIFTYVIFVVILYKICCRCGSYAVSMNQYTSLGVELIPIAFSTGTCRIPKAHCYNMQQESNDFTNVYINSIPVYMSFLSLVLYRRCKYEPMHPLEFPKSKHQHFIWSM